MSKLVELKKEMQDAANPLQSKLLSGFFKTAKGEYGEGDVFLGIKVPVQRAIAKKYTNLGLEDIQKLLSSKIHEHRLTALFILIDLYKLSDSAGKKRIFDTYLANTKNINNWDLVDLSASNIVGHYLLDKKRDVLYKLAKSKHIWERRIAVLATYTFIRSGQFDDTLKIAEILLSDTHDLIHKAVGWMLREVGKRDQKVEESFLKKHYQQMPRTMLRYSIEKFDEKKKKFYMAK
jgi:3-methyladenine DNA glycosylase AlkD